MASAIQQSKDFLASALYEVFKAQIDLELEKCELCLEAQLTDFGSFATREQSIGARHVLRTLVKPLFEQLDKDMKIALEQRIKTTKHETQQDVAS